MSVYEDIKTGLNQAIEYESNNKQVAEIIKTFEQFVNKKGEGVILYNEDGSVIKLQDVVNLLVEQKTEIERLNDMKFTQEHCNLYEENEWLKVELKHQINENAALQKQADELKTKVELEKEYGDIKVAQALADFKIWKQQAVKDRAKEIFEKIFNECWVLNIELEYPSLAKKIIERIAKECGVEVG